MHFLLACLFCLAAAADGAAAAGERAEPHGALTRQDFVAAKSVPAGDRFGKNGENGDAAVTSGRYDMLRQALDLRIDPQERTISGAVQMVFASDYAGLSSIVFDLVANLDVDSISHRSGSLAFSHLADSVVVTLPTALAPGTVDSLVVYYGGRPTSPVVNRGLMFKTHFPVPPIPLSELVPMVANMSQPAYAQSWWPCKDRPDDKFLMLMSLTVPDTLIGVSNGTMLGETAAGPGWRTFHWREDHPIASYLVSVAITDYVLLETPCTTGLGTVVPLRNWVFPGDVAAAGVDFAPLCDMMDFCESVYGPYPFAGEKYGHAEFLWPGAMEHQTVTSIGASSLDGLGDREWLIVHELGHQWFGDSLTPAAWADIWLNEGLATYTEALWFEHTLGSAAYDTYLANLRQEGEWIDQGPVYDPIPIFPGRVIYDKGAWIVHMVRARLGDAAFFPFLTDWAGGASRRLGQVATQEFVDLAGNWAGEDLNGFLWPYLTTTVLPVVSFSYQASDGLAGPDTHLRVDLAQLQSPLFDNTYPVVVTTTAGQTTLAVNLAAATAGADFELAAPITAVQLDPRQQVLWRPGAAEQTSAGLTLAFPNPTRGEYVVFRYSLAAAARPRLQVFDLMGREVVSRDLGPRPAGVYEWGWDVTGDQGARVPSGTYWAAMQLDGRRSVVRFSVVR
jgi:aminopeptidase N